MDEVLEMSTKELERYDVLNGVRRKAMTQGKAAELLGISDRQVRKLLTLLKKKGPSGLVSRRRGRPSNHKKAHDLQTSGSLDCSREIRGFWSVLCQREVSKDSWSERFHRDSQEMDGRGAYLDSRSS